MCCMAVGHYLTAGCEDLFLPLTAAFTVKLLNGSVLQVVLCLKFESVQNACHLVMSHVYH